MKVLNKWKEIISKRCKSLKKKTYPQTKTNTPNNTNTLPKSKSCPPSPRPPMAPGGCFPVYVGPKRQRFVMKAKDASHPLFQMLLEDAEKQYGYNSEGPLLLPCDVGLFCKVLAEIDSDHDIDAVRSPVCGAYGSYSLLSPSRLLKINGF